VLLDYSNYISFFDINILSKKKPFQKNTIILLFLLLFLDDVCEFLLFFSKDER